MMINQDVLLSAGLQRSQWKKSLCCRRSFNLNTPPSTFTTDPPLNPDPSAPLLLFFFLSL